MASGRVDWGALISEHRGEYSALRRLKISVPEEAAWFARMDDFGHHHIAEVLGEGLTISEFAQINAIPVVYAMRYVQKKMPKDLVADARRSAASVYAARASLALELPDPDSKTFLAEVGLAKARAEHYMTMAERHAPEDFAPPLPTMTIMPPPAITLHLDKIQPMTVVPDKYKIPVDINNMGPIEDAEIVEPETQVVATFETFHELQDLDQKYRVNQGQRAVERSGDKP